MSRIWNWAREEFLQILPVWAFFSVAFGLVVLTRMAIFGEYHIKPQEPARISCRLAHHGQSGPAHRFLF